MTDFEQQQIKGLTRGLLWRWAIGLITSTATICGTVLYVYYDFKATLAANSADIAVLKNSDKEQNQKIQTSSNRIDLLTYRMDQLSQPKTP